MTTTQGFKRCYLCPQAVAMNLVATSLQSLRQMFRDKTDEFINLTNNVHMLWLEEIQQEAKRMFSR